MYRFFFSSPAVGVRDKREVNLVSGVRLDVPEPSLTQNSGVKECGGVGRGRVGRQRAVVLLWHVSEH